jgi:hypothetical protein
MAADLQPVDALAQVVGIVDRPARQPQHLALELAEDGEVVLRDLLLLLWHSASRSSCPALCRASTPSVQPSKAWMAGTSPAMTLQRFTTAP